MKLLLSSYDDARPHIEDGDIVFIHKTNALFSSLISFLTRSRYTHVGIAFWADVGTTRRLMIVEAQRFTSRRIMNLSFYRNRDFTIVGGTREWLDYSDEALSHIGIKGYGWLKAFYIGIREYLSPWYKVEYEMSHPDGEICSQFVAEMMEYEETIVSPGSLFREILRAGGRIKMVIKKALN